MTFSCNVGNEGYGSTFVASTTYTKGTFLSGLGKVVGAATPVAGTLKAGMAFHTGTEILGERCHGMGPQLRKGA